MIISGNWNLTLALRSNTEQSGRGSGKPDTVATNSFGQCTARDLNLFKRGSLYSMPKYHCTEQVHRSSEFSKGTSHICEFLCQNISPFNVSNKFIKDTSSNSNNDNNQKIPLVLVMVMQEVGGCPQAQAGLGILCPLQPFLSLAFLPIC